MSMAYRASALVRYRLPIAFRRDCALQGNRSLSTLSLLHRRPAEPSSPYSAAYSISHPIHRSNTVPSVRTLAKKSGRESNAATANSGTEPINVYRNLKQLRAAGMSSIALLQGGFWVCGAYWTVASVSEPVVSPLWMVGGAGLSGMFAWMVSAYLSRSVAVLSLCNSSNSQSSLFVQTYRFGGLLGKPVEIPARKLLGGPKGADENERHWTFGVKENKEAGASYYIVDRKKGVLDEAVLGTVCSCSYGADEVMILLHKRQAMQMKTRWKNWEEAKGDLVANRKG